MPRAPAKVSQADLTRVLKAIASAGLNMRVEILPDGKITMEPVEVAGKGRPVHYAGEIKL